MGRKPRDQTGDAWAVAAGNVIRREREKLEMTQDAFGKLSRRDRNEISHLENHGKGIELRTLDFYAEALGMDVRKLFEMCADDKDRQLRRAKRGLPIITDAQMKKSGRKQGPPRP